ncbi:hypothetical protein VD0002_g6710 [Verticillium dahliae]|uniref:Uncharacterized protein n=1 Tax=Verticillium dahliae TaxID=27337 RepID=A0AA44WIN4_VERDA|nr:hypothetical protein BJF96_g4968 [Verticillium dahliae]PNH53854.1 hypothetical protein VD0003_g3582 [Verticillium dahliae]PNH61005.1 hypothetical protein VD0002_g6710 [Verticillium dahliae]
MAFRQHGKVKTHSFLSLPYAHVMHTIAQSEADFARDTTMIEAEPTINGEPYV